jgi:hypothetical protein
VNSIGLLDFPSIGLLDFLLIFYKLLSDQLIISFVGKNQKPHVTSNLVHKLYRVQTIGP